MSYRESKTSADDAESGDNNHLHLENAKLRRQVHDQKVTVGGLAIISGISAGFQAAAMYMNSQAQANYANTTDSLKAENSLLRSQIAEMGNGTGSAATSDIILSSAASSANHQSLHGQWREREQGKSGAESAEYITITPTETDEGSAAGKQS